MLWEEERVLFMQTLNLQAKQKDFSHKVTEVIEQGNFGVGKKLFKNLAGKHVVQCRKGNQKT